MREAAAAEAWASGIVDPGFRVCESSSPRLLDRVRDALRVHHYSRRTERAYVAWIRRYILFHGKRHPAEMGAEEVSRFLTALAVEARVSASTQNQALAALLFLYAQVLGNRRGSTTWCERRDRAGCRWCCRGTRSARSLNGSTVRRG